MDSTVSWLLGRGYLEEQIQHDPQYKIQMKRRVGLVDIAVFKTASRDLSDLLFIIECKSQYEKRYGLDQLRSYMKAAKISFGIWTDGTEIDYLFQFSRDAMPEGRESFGAVLRRFRKASGKTLQEVADNAGVTKSYLSRIENSDTGPPPEPSRNRIAAAIGIDPYHLTLSLGELPSDLLSTFQENPEDWLLILETLGAATPKRRRELARRVRDGKW